MIAFLGGEGVNLNNNSAYETDYYYSVQSYRYREITLSL